jgi:hypothetical protein
VRNDRLPFFLKDLVAFLMASTARVHMAQPKRNAADDSLLDGFYEILGLAPKTIELHRANTNTFRTLVGFAFHSTFR